MVDLSLPRGGASRLINTWRRRALERRELARLDHRSLRDLGLSASQVRFEANKPFWRD